MKYDCAVMEIEAKYADALSSSGKRNLLALNDEWAPISQLSRRGATGSGMDLLFCRYDRKLCDRRWERWSASPGRKAGEGYLYRLTPFGRDIQEILKREFPE